MFSPRNFAKSLMKIFLEKILEVTKKHKGNVKSVETMKSHKKLSANVHLKDGRVLPIDVEYDIDKNELFKE